MSLDAYRWVWQQSRQKGNTRLTLLALAEHVDRDGAAWPSVETLATYTQLKRRAVQNHFRALREDGEIIVAEWGGRRDGKLHSLPSPPPQARRHRDPRRAPRGRTDEVRRAWWATQAKSTERDDPGSGAPSLTPDSGIAEALVDLSRLFADGLIEAGRVGPGAASAADSPEWLDEMEALVFDQLADPGRMDPTTEVIGHAASFTGMGGRSTPLPCSASV